MCLFFLLLCIYIMYRTKSSISFSFPGPPWVPSMVAVSQSSLLTHSYAIPQPPPYSQGASVQSPIIGVTPTIQTPVPPHHPLMTAHFQVPPHSSQPPGNLVLTLQNQSPYSTNQPPITPSPMPAGAHSIVGNGHLTHPFLQPPALPAAALPLTNGQPPLLSANQEGQNGLQMLRTVGMGKYEFTDPGHPKGKSAQPYHGMVLVF